MEALVLRPHPDLAQASALLPSQRFAVRAIIMSGTGSLYLAIYMGRDTVRAT